ncbi:ferredoxin [Actinoplanes subglobosus]|uniref:Ferredoxin n=1 Tax=Actinoplanes subglobosus TaxID=1547892 RepID=A0ABV8IZB6_9ACTN
MRIRIDRDRCVGAGACAHAYPEVFDQDDVEGLVMLVGDATDEAATRRAVVQCPVAAISVGTAANE